MKPLKLTMGAFCSYADVQSIDFTMLGKNGLYLISGETGSGKTTIFDAISFALFGKASGIGRSDYTMLRSDFADEKNKTFVELEFAAGNNNRYHIKRTIKKTGQDVDLILPDGTVMNGDRNTKSKITEIIGLNHDQFSQIVMIAQNDFLRFLQSGTDERVKILRRIFGTEALRQFQEDLKARAKQERDKREVFAQLFNRHGVDLFKREEQFTEWEEQIGADQLSLTDTEHLLIDIDKNRQNLATSLAVAEELCKKFTDLSAYRVLLNEHTAKADEIEAMKQCAQKGETALFKVKPIADEAMKAKSEHAVARSGLTIARKEENASVNEWEQIKIAIEMLPVIVNPLPNKDFIMIEKKQKELAKSQSEFETLNEEFLNEDSKYKYMEEVFLRSQAGLLAKTLKSGEPCPVCGSSVHPEPALLPDDAVSETQLDSAKKFRDAIQVKREEKSQECSNLNGEIKEQTTRLLSDAEAKVRSMRTLVTERLENEQRLLKLSNQAHIQYHKTLQEYGFADESEYSSALIEEDRIAEMKEQLLEYEKNGEQLSRDIIRLEEETADEEPPDLESLRTKTKTAADEWMVLNEKRDEVKSRLEKTKHVLAELRHSAAELEKTEKVYASVKQLADVANGKLDFETYAQATYFERVLKAANMRLKLMSQNRYILLRKQEAVNKRSKTGLDLEVLDAYTGKTRSANSLSGGESFMASLSLALGLSDAVQQSAGGIRLDAMFIDEGFGTLDEEVLELAIKTLSDMAGKECIIGIISHVTELRERIEKQIRVEKTVAGSKIIMQKNINIRKEEGHYGKGNLVFN